MAYSIVEEYFSGQGVLMIGTRSPLGRPQGLQPLGNVPAVSIKNATTVVEHTESTTGARGTDKRLLTAVKVSIDITLENFDSNNLARALQGNATQVPGATITGEAMLAYPGLITPFAHINASAVTMKKASATLAAYVDAATAWDYKLNAQAGSVLMNDGSVLGFGANLGVVATAITVGTTTSITITNTCNVGDTFFFGQGWTGADAAAVNGKSAVVLTASGSAITVALNTAAKTITVGTPKSAWSGMAITADYTYASQQTVDAFTQGIPELYLRFEGLNTAENNAPVIVEVFKFSTDPTQDFSLISDALQQFVLSGSILKDSLQVVGSQYYRVTKIDALS